MTISECILLQLHILDLWDFKSLVNLQNDTVYIKRIPIVNINMVLGWKPDLEQEFEYVDWTKKNSAPQ